MNGLQWLLLGVLTVAVLSALNLHEAAKGSFWEDDRRWRLFLRNAAVLVAAWAAGLAWWLR